MLMTDHCQDVNGRALTRDDDGGDSDDDRDDVVNILFEEKRTC